MGTFSAASEYLSNLESNDLTTFYKGIAYCGISGFTHASLCSIWVGEASRMSIQSVKFDNIL